MAEWIPENVRKSLIDLIKRLNRFRIKYLILGAIPVQYYGRPRISWDVDVVLITPTTKNKLFSIMDSEKYQPIRGEESVFKFKDLETESFIDVLLKPSELGLTSESLKRKKKVRISRVNVNIPSPEDYILTKLVARRPGTNDYHDVITTLENLYNELDWPYLEKRAKTLGSIRPEWKPIYPLIKYYKEGLKRKIK